MVGDLVVGGRCVRGAEAEQGLEAGQRGAAPVVAEDELVQVDRQVFGRDAVVGALQPGFQVRECAMGARRTNWRSGKRARWMCVWCSKPAALRRL